MSEKHLLLHSLQNRPRTGSGSVMRLPVGFTKESLGKILKFSLIFS